MSNNKLTVYTLDRTSRLLSMHDLAGESLSWSELISTAILAEESEEDADQA
jgi:hypothetical protein